MPKLAIVFLTYNEELNLEKALIAVKSLDAPIIIIDSFSTDNTHSIAKKYRCIFLQNKFETHTLQWQYALSQLPEDVEWVLGLDADQELSVELQNEIKNTIEIPNNPIHGYYICRRNYFLGKWIKHGGYYPRYLLKLFKKSSVYLDPSELMDHHFYVNGQTSKLKNDLIENNLKEDLNFWKVKHLRYAKLQAKEEFELNLINKGNLFGNQDERRLFFKNVWNKLPLFIRPVIYFIYRYFFQLGFLDGRVGSLFHYLQAYWYRNQVDLEIYDLKSKSNKNYPVIAFVLKLSILSVLFYYFNLFYIGITGEGGSFYLAFLDQHLNYIKWWRDSLMYFSTKLLSMVGLNSTVYYYNFKITNGPTVWVGWSCLGYGVSSIWAALLLSYPFRYINKWKYLIMGLLAIYTINVLRIAAVGYAYTNYRNINIDHHLVFNICTYIFIFLMIRFLINKEAAHVHTRN